MARPPRKAQATAALAAAVSVMRAATTTSTTEPNRPGNWGVGWGGGVHSH